MGQLEQYLTENDLWGECLGARVTVAGRYAGYLTEIRFNRAYCGIKLDQQWAPVSYPLVDVTLDISAPPTWGVLQHLMLKICLPPLEPGKPFGEAVLEKLLASLPKKDEA